MIIKRYLVHDMNEAMIKIRNELGSEAIIVSKKSVRQRGFMKFFRKKIIEVTAAVDKKPEDTKYDKKQAKSQSYENNRQHDNEISKELDDLKKMVQALSKSQNAVTNDSELVKGITEALDSFEFDKEIKDEFYSYCSKNNVDLSKVNRLTLYNFIKEVVNNKVNIASLNDNKIQIYIGPTGVGKTTTIAKMAANEVLIQKRRIALITVDTYRIGAVEQLKTYANILDVPIEVVLTKEDLYRALEKFKSYDRILIDSMGRSDKNHEHLMELNDYFKDIEEKSTYLVLSITTKNKDLRSIIENYKKIGYDNIIITKLDETDSYGNIINISHYSSKAISYLCTGQNVPDDIEEANRDKLFQYVWGEIEK